MSAIPIPFGGNHKPAQQATKKTTSVELTSSYCSIQIRFAKWKLINFGHHPAKFEKTMTEIIENALIIQNYAGFFSKDLTRHQYVFASWNPSKQGKDEKYQQDIIELSSSNHQAIAKTDTDTDTDSDTDSDTEKKQSKI